MLENFDILGLFTCRAQGNKLNAKIKEIRHKHRRRIPFQLLLWQLSTKIGKKIMLFES